MYQKYTQRVESFIAPFLDKNGYRLIKCEFVNEDGNFHLRLFIDLMDNEKTKRISDISLKSAEKFSSSTGPLMDGGFSDMKIYDHDIKEKLSDVIDHGEEGLERESRLPENSDVIGISIDDCVKVSRYLSKWLDRVNFIKETYTLEVCSKGFID